MQSLERTSLHASSDWPSSGEDDSEVFLPQEERSEITRGHSRLSSSSLSSSSSSQLGWSSTESEKEKNRGNRGDLLFAQKCLELQGFVRPLLELLNGLKKGRFDKGLSSFQQSVAMDRIQRIMGLLQKPHIGEKYLPTLLQVEMMLKHWFPHVSLQSTGTCVSTQHSGQNLTSNSSSLPVHKHKDQLHIPVKKRRLSWSDTDSSTTPPPVALKRYHVNDKQKEIQGACLSPALAPQTDQPEPEKREPLRSETLCCCEPSVTWVHVSPLVSPHKSSSNKISANEATRDRSTHFLLTLPSTSSMGSPATQDSAVSSTTSSSEPVANQSHQETTSQAEEPGRSSVITTQLSSPLLT